MKTFDEFLTEGKKNKMRLKAFKKGGKQSETTIAVNPSIEKPITQTTVAVTANPKKAANRVLLQNQVEE
jgi:hypothetical protein